MSTGEMQVGTRVVHPWRGGPGLPGRGRWIRPAVVDDEAIRTEIENRLLEHLGIEFEAEELDPGT